LTFGPNKAISLEAPGLRLAAGDTVTLGVRPEHCDLVTDGAGDLDAAIELAEYLGSETYFNCEAPGIGPFTVRAAGQIRRQRSDILKLRFDRDHLHLFGGNERALLHGTVA